ncbi:photosystem II protein, Psb35-related [Crocosphaera sp. Alani8]|uniref:photosystem II protein, Psb35-related n=1 Tax=Crocosphaera sp. Alani8 TaxID=3038952 RepID=UPI00313C9AF3
MFALVISLLVVGWVAAAVIGTQAYFRGEQTKTIHERNWNSETFETIAKSITGKEIDSDRTPGFLVDTYGSSNLAK